MILSDWLVLFYESLMIDYGVENSEGLFAVEMVESTLLL